MREKFKLIEEMFIGYFEQEVAKINAEFENTKCNVQVYSPPDEANRNYFSMSISCVLNKGNHNGADNIALGLHAHDLNERFTIYGELCWGDPSGDIEAELFDKPVEVTEDNLTIIKEKLPSLISKLRELIRDNTDNT